MTCRQVHIHPDKYFENTLNILRKLARVEQDRLGTAVNKTLWNTAPAVVNAYYSRNKNQISACNWYSLTHIARLKLKYII